LAQVSFKDCREFFRLDRIRDEVIAPGPGAFGPVRFAGVPRLGDADTGVRCAKDKAAAGGHATAEFNDAGPEKMPRDVKTMGAHVGKMKLLPNLAK